MSANTKKRSRSKKPTAIGLLQRALDGGLLNGSPELKAEAEKLLPLRLIAQPIPPEGYFLLTDDEVAAYWRVVSMRGRSIPKRGKDGDKWSSLVILIDPDIYWYCLPSDMLEPAQPTPPAANEH